MSILHKVVAAVTLSAMDDEVNAIDLLKRDHDKVDGLFAECRN